MAPDLTDRVREVLVRARDLALTQDAEPRAIRLGQLLLALLEDPDSSASTALADCCDLPTLRGRLSRYVTGSREGHWWEATEIPYAAESKQALALAAAEAQASGETHVRPVHLLHALFRLDPRAWQADLAGRAAEEAGIDLPTLGARVLAAGTA